MTQPAQAPKKPIYLRPWFIVVAVIVVLWGASSLIGGGGGSSTPAATPVASPSAKPAKKAEPTKPATRDAATIAAAVDAALKEGLAVKSYQDACGSVNWACAISEVKPGNVAGNVEVHVQDQLSKAEAEQIALYVLNFSVQKVPDVEWVIVHDSSGVVQGQKMRSDSKLA